MPKRIEAVESAELPKLAWCARVDYDRDEIAVRHGSGVEHGDDWLVEGVWDGRFEDHDFHRSQNFFGSGMRLEDGKVFLAPSSATVDRLFMCSHDRGVAVANSLTALLALTGARLDPAHDYRADTKAILVGIEKYDRRFHALHPTIKDFFQVYCENAILDDGEIRFERRDRKHDLKDFSHYCRLVHKALLSMRDNWTSGERKTSLEDFSTLSTGYDSSAVSCLVRDIGVRRCFSYTGAWSKATAGRAEYDARPIADALGMETISLNGRASNPEGELHLYASSPVGAQLPLLAMARHIETHAGGGAVVFTGYHGDVIWNANPQEKFLDAHCSRMGIAGLDLAQLRLHSGFVNVPVPFIYAENLRDIVRISQSEEMEPWRLHNDYDRPIPRRLLEEAGVGRTLFGMRKSAILTRQSTPRDATLRARYFAHLENEYRVSGTFVRWCLAGDRLAFRFMKRLVGLASRLPGFGGIGKRLAARRELLGQGDSLFWRGRNFRLLLHLWSVTVLSGRLAAQLEPQRSGNSPAA